MLIKRFDFRNTIINSGISDKRGVICVSVLIEKMNQAQALPSNILPYIKDGRASR